MLRVVDSEDVKYGETWLALKEGEDAREVAVVRSRRTERHLLRPFDVVIAARASTIRIALVPPSVCETAAGASLMVVRPDDPGSGMGHYLWYFLTSSRGTAQLNEKVRTHRTVRSLSARDIESIRIPLPTPRQLDLVASIVEASGEEFAMARMVEELRRRDLRDSVINEIAEVEQQY